MIQLIFSESWKRKDIFNYIPTNVDDPFLTEVFDVGRLLHPTAESEMEEATEQVIYRMINGND